jgi:Kef-type K+ transport system membrane component KefB
MSPLLQLLLALFVLITGAKLAGLLSTRLGQPAVLGEILAGLVLGPSLINLFGLPYFSDAHLPETVNQLAEIGVILLMFLAGMEVDLVELRRSGQVVVLAGVLGVIVPLVLGFATALPFGYNNTSALAIGMLLTATSVSISAQTLLELGVLRSREGIALLGAAVVDDVLVIVLVSIVLAVLTGGGSVADIGLLFLRIATYLGVFGLVGWFLVPWLLDTADKLPISQGALAAAVMMALLFAWAAEVVGHVALITGAFLAGVFAGRSEVHHRVLEGISALTYGFFVPIFFANIGLHANLRDLQGSLLLFATSLILVAVVSKVLGGGLGARIGGFTNGESVRLGIGMISRGEVGLIVASLFLAAGVVTDEVVTVAVLMVLATTLVTPPLLRRAFAGYQPAGARVAKSSGR